MSLTKVSYSMITGAPANVMDYGATGDGTTDDAPAILAAAVFVSGLGGGTVYFPAPSVAYAMNPTYFTGLSNVIFAGNGAKIISRQPANLPYSPFHMVTCTDLEFVGLDIDGQYPYWMTQAVNPNLNNMNIVLNNCVRVNIHDNYYMIPAITLEYSILSETESIPLALIPQSPIT